MIKIMQTIMIMTIMNNRLKQNKMILIILKKLNFKIQMYNTVIVKMKTLLIHPELSSIKYLSLFQEEEGPAEIL